jgi:hypothetical protein
MVVCFREVRCLAEVGDAILPSDPRFTRSSSTCGGMSLMHAAIRVLWASLQSISTSCVASPSHF